LVQVKTTRKGGTKREVTTLFDVPERWEEEWQGMPEYVQQDQTSFRTLYIHFRNEEDVQAFGRLIDQKISELTKFIWYPKAKAFHYVSKVYVDES